MLMVQVPTILVKSAQAANSQVHTIDPPLSEIDENKIEQLNFYVLAWKAKYKDTHTKCMRLKKENNLLKDRVSSWEENLKTQEQKHKTKLESLCQSSKEALRKYQEDTKKNLNEALPKLRSNLVLHTQWLWALLIQKICTESLNFNVYNSEGEDWENFQKEWKQSPNFFIPTKIKIEDEKVDLEDSLDLEKAPATDEALTKLNDPLTEGGN
ncbi:hypothetical protein J1N35_041638 [Gossypium stocksii]|uniref:Uncharacterized protein n=1 Tax=Gossypium stocksii TaxID=47602 RepID=A0A9D3ZIU9_9ROSI|nr:hypothetical protein J1N35_041638 [Gossypium stocksii]